MKVTSNRSGTKPKKKRRKATKRLEEANRTVFLNPIPVLLPRGPLSIAKIVPAITTYGVYDRPA
jgi:hypothetical protein